MTAYSKIIDYIKANPGTKGIEAARALDMSKDTLYPLLREAQENGGIRKEGNTCNARFYFKGGWDE